MVPATAGRTALVALLVALSACAPPAAVKLADTSGGEAVPTIEILYPPPSPTICVDDGEPLEFLIVANIDNIEFVLPPGSEEDEDGEGHWHLFFGNEYITAPLGNSILYQSDPGEFEAGDELLVRVTLQSNQHNDIEHLGDQREFALTETPNDPTRCDN